MKNKPQIVVIAPEAELPLLTLAVNETADAWPDEIEIIPCAVGDARTPLILAAADAVIAGAVIETAADEQKLTELLLLIREARAEARPESLLAVALWGAESSELARALDHATVLCAREAEAHRPPLDLLRQRIVDAFPLIEPLETAARYQLLAEAMLRCHFGAPAASPETQPTATEQNSRTRFRDFLAGLNPSLRRRLQEQLDTLRQTLAVTRTEYSAALARQLHLEAARAALRQEVAELQSENQRLHDELKAGTARLQAVQTESRKSQETVRREISAMLSEHTRSVSEMLTRLSEFETQIRTLSGQVRSLTEERESLQEDLRRAQLATTARQVAGVRAQAAASPTEHGDLLLIAAGGQPAAPSAELSGREIVDVQELIEEVRRMIQPLQAERRLSISIEVESAARYIRSNQLILCQILFNLMSNAVCYTYRGMVTVTVRRQSDTVTIAVSDTGMGMSREQLDKYLNPESETWKNSTSECGLPAVQRLIAELGGRLEVKSAVNAGSTFSVIFRPDELSASAGSACDNKFVPDPIRTAPDCKRPPLR
jgi:signal transduction histidine kinase